MAAMNPILRVKRACRSFGADDEQSDEVVSAIDDYYLSRRESDDRIRAIMAEQVNRMLLGVLVIVSLGVAILALVN